MNEIQMISKLMLRWVGEEEVKPRKPNVKQWGRINKLQQSLTQDLESIQLIGLLEQRANRKATTRDKLFSVGS